MPHNEIRIFGKREGKTVFCRNQPFSSGTGGDSPPVKETFHLKDGKKFGKFLRGKICRTVLYEDAAWTLSKERLPAFMDDTRKALPIRRPRRPGFARRSPLP